MAVFNRLALVISEYMFMCERAYCRSSVYLSILIFSMILAVMFIIDDVIYSFHHTYFISKGYVRLRSAECHSSCEECSGDGPLSCTSCSAPAVLAPSGLCSPRCPAGYYSDENRVCQSKYIFIIDV